MCRYLHLNVLYPVEYPKIALQICQNLYQNQYMKYKQNKLESLLKEQQHMDGQNKISTSDQAKVDSTQQPDADESSKSAQNAEKHKATQQSGGDQNRISIDKIQNEAI